MSLLLVSVKVFLWCVEETMEKTHLSNLVATNHHARNRNRPQLRGQSFYYFASWTDIYVTNTNQDLCPTVISVGLCHTQCGSCYFKDTGKPYFALPNFHITIIDIRVHIEDKHFNQLKYCILDLPSLF